MFFRHRQGDPTSRQDGVTIVELLVVMILIGVLTAIAIPIFANQRTSAHNATLKRDLHNTARAVESWYAAGYQNSTATDVSGNGAQYMYMSSNGDSTVWPYRVEVGTAGFPTPTPVTRNSGLGVRVFDSQGGYCIIGVRKGSDYQYGVSGASWTGWDNLLFYDSLLGGVKKRSQLTATGACQYFR